MQKQMRNGTLICGSVLYKAQDTVYCKNACSIQSSLLRYPPELLLRAKSES